MKRKSSKRAGRVITSLILVFSLLAGGNAMECRVKAGDVSQISNPVVADKEVKWSCVYLGNYPQDELTKEVDAQIFEQLSKNQQWDSNNDVTVEGKKYHRVCETDATSTMENFEWNEENTYHYFVYEPIKWRVLKVEDSKAILLSDQILDTQKYNQKAKRVTWQESTMRSWLNGYDATQNAVQESYETSGFAAMAFTTEEKSQIETVSRQNAQDKIYLLDATEATTEAYGLGMEAARVAGSSQYAQAMGAPATKGSWWTASSGNTELSEVFVKEDGSLHTKGYSVAYAGIGVRVALTLDVSEDFTYAGTVTSNGKVDEVVPSDKPLDTPKPTPTITATATHEVTLQPEETMKVLPTKQPDVTESPAVPSTTERVVTPRPTQRPSNQPEATVPVTKQPTGTKQPSGTNVPLTTQAPVQSATPTAGVNPLPTGGQLPQEKVTAGVGTSFHDEETGASYQILTSTGATGTVVYKQYSGKETSVAVPDIVEYKGNIYDVVKIGNSCFKNKTTIKSVSLGKDVKVIGSGAFAGCSKLKRVKLSTSLTTIGAKAFYRCSALTAVIIPAKVRTIGTGSFAGCKNLKRITVKTKKLTAAKMGVKAFNGIPAKAKIKVPKGKLAAYKSIFSSKGKIGTKVKVK